MGTSVLIHLLGGVALLLWGLRMVRTGVLRAFGADLRRAVGVGLRNRLSAFGAGFAVTGLLQSSTATALMTASFAERGLVATAPALAVMLGADVGTSLVAQALSIDLGWLSPLLVLAGVAAFMVSSSTRWRDLGRAVIGLGLMLLALRLIVAASEPVRHSEVLQDVLQALGGEPLLALIVAIGLTWLAHSSLAIILLVMTLAQVGLVPIGLAFVLVLGANLGGALPAVLATWGGDVQARRVTVGNLGFRTAGVLVAMPLLDTIGPWVALLEPDIGRQVVNFHTLFNVTLAIVFLPLLPIAARLATRLLPATPHPDDPRKPRYLDPMAIDSPPLAIAAAARETLRMGDTLEGMLRDTLKVFKSADRKLADEISRRDDVVDSLHEAIKLYLTQVSREAMGDTDGRRCMEIIAFTTNLEHIGDIIDKNLIELAVKKMKHRLSFSDEGLREIEDLHASVLNTLRLSLALFMGGDVKMARQLLEEKVQFRERERAAAERHLERLRSGRIESIETSSLHLDILRDLKRIHSHLTSVAYPILEQTGELRQSRLATEPAPQA
ncbi:MAG: Na/Pi cotransporter family protein [Proteobacteria bacterium]|nr:Na/Pi cotransporter family protein [Pseudomonadota bacterium]MBI3498351.1 Na/Pi cotransporter family protein [Pseudomonadota bacterium]